MAVTPTTPPLTLLPDPPLPTDAEAVFDAKAGASLTAQVQMVAQINVALTWQAGAMAATQDYKTVAGQSAQAAADSASAAAQSATAASQGGAQQVDLAAQQVQLAAQQAGNAAGSAATATAMAQAAGTSAGVPVPAALRALITNASGVASWSGYLLPVPSGQGGKSVVALLDGSGYELKAVGQAIGDVLISSVVPDATYIPANGATRLQADFPALYAALGPNKASAPITLVENLTAGSTQLSAAISPDAKYLATCSDTNLSIFPRSGDAWGTAATFILPASIASPSLNSGRYFIPKPTFSNDSVYLAIPLSTSPFIAIYKRTGSTFVKLANPGTLPTSQVNGLSFTSDSSYLALALQSAPYVFVYKRTVDAFAKIADPAVSPVSVGQCVSFSPDGQYLALAVQSATGGLVIYKKNSDILSKLSDPAIYPSANTSCVAFSPDGARLLVSSITTIGTLAPAVIYGRVVDVFTPVALGVAANNAAFSPDGKYIAAAGVSDQSAAVYDVSGAVPSLVTTLYPAGSSTVASVSFGASGTAYLGNYLVVGTNSSRTTYRDGYPINPNTEFKVPGLTVVNSLPAVDTATQFKQPQLVPYIKAKVA
jgi:hypothetical protein